MKFIEKHIYIIKTLKGADRFAYVFSSAILYITSAFVLVTISLKLLNLQGFTNIFYVYNIPEIKLNALTLGALSVLVLPGLAALQKGLKQLPPHLKDTVDEGNVKNLDKGTALFKEGYTFLKSEGIYEFIRKDPLEIKKALFYFFIFFLIIYLYNNLQN